MKNLNICDKIYEIFPHAQITITSFKLNCKVENYYGNTNFTINENGDYYFSEFNYGTELEKKDISKLVGDYAGETKRLYYTNKKQW